MSDARGTLPEQVDVLVVGGGIHGAGVLQAAAAHGWSAALIEERELAGGTSSRSSKLIHGGLRYLESGQLALVRESLAERAILLRIAPKLVHLVPFHVPIYRDTTRRPWQIRAGLAMYAVLGKLEQSALFSRLHRREWDQLDGLSTDGLQSVFRYNDGQTDDAALTRAVVRSAESLGASAHTGVRFVAARRDENGWRVELERAGNPFTLSASALVNAAGPWINLVRERLEPKPPGFEIELVAGAHIELSGTLERGIYYTEAPRDHRAVFVMPWNGHVLVGTTETPYAGDPRAIEPLASEVEYLLEVLRRYFPKRDPQILRSWSGLRVLPRGSGKAFDRPRETTLVCDDEHQPRTIAIYGGKLTGYRATAEKVAARLARTLPAHEPRADTATLAL